MKKKVLFYTLFILSVLFFAVMYIDYEKYKATWWGVNVTLISLPLGVAVAFGMRLLFEYFLGVGFMLKRWAFIMLTFATLLAPVLGKYVAEAPKSTPEYEQLDQNERYRQSRGYYFINSFSQSSSSVSDDSGGGGGFDCDDCGEGIAYLLLIVLVLIMLIGSAFIPHFWILAGFTFLSLMLMYIVNEEDPEDYLNY